MHMKYDDKRAKVNQKMVAFQNAAFYEKSEDLLHPRAA